MIQEPQRVALPALLRQGLVAFRESEGNQQIYRVRDNWKGQTYQFERLAVFCSGSSAGLQRLPETCLGF